MEHSGSSPDGVRRLLGDLPAWAPEVPDTSAEQRLRPRYGSLTAIGLLIGLTSNFVAAAWQPSFRNGDGHFLLPFFAFWNIGIFLAYIAAMAVAVWLCLQDHERAARQRFLSVIGTLTVIAVCL